MIDNLDVLTLIASGLEIRDVYNLRNACKLYHKIDININIFNKINSSLNDIFGEHYLSFKNFMKQYKCVIGGSFILQCILNEKWNSKNKHSDIDLYLSNNLEKESCKYFESIGYEGPKFDDRDGKYNMPNIIKWYWNYDKLRIRVNKLDDGIYDRQYYSITDLYTPVQVIGLELDENSNGLDNILGCLKTNYDLSVCKNCYYYDGRDHIILSNLDNIFNKVTTLDIEHILPETINRIEKYENRGFKILNKDEFLERTKDEWIKIQNDKLIKAENINISDSLFSELQIIEALGGNPRIEHKINSIFRELQINEKLNKKSQNNTLMSLSDYLYYHNI